MTMRSPFLTAAILGICAARVLPACGTVATLEAAGFALAFVEDFVAVARNVEGTAAGLEAKINIFLWHGYRILLC